LRDAVLRAFRELPAYKSQQASYRAHPPANDSDSKKKNGKLPLRWDEWADDVRLGLLRTPLGTFVSVWAFAGYTCEEFGGGFSVVYEVSGDAAKPELVLRSQVNEHKLVEPNALIDLDGDGIPELLFSGEEAHSFQDLGVLRKVGPWFRPVHEI